MQISRKAWEAYRNRLAAVNSKAADLMTDYVKKHGLNDAKAVIDYAFAISTKYGEAAASLACQMYDQIAAAANADVLPAEAADTATYQEVAQAVNGTKKESQLPEKFGGAVSRLVKLAASDTTLKNAKRDHAEFAWVPSGDGCAFCTMLASNGWRTASDETIKGNHAEHIHPHCRCEFAIRFSERDGVAGYDPQKYKDIYDNAEGNAWQDKLNSMEKAYRDKHKDEINARKRELYARKKEAESRGENGQ